MVTTSSERFPGASVLNVASPNENVMSSVTLKLAALVWPVATICDDTSNRFAVGESETAHERALTVTEPRRGDANRGLGGDYAFV